MPRQSAYAWAAVVLGVLTVTMGASGYEDADVCSLPDAFQRYPPSSLSSSSQTIAGITYGASTSNEWANYPVKNAFEWDGPASFITSGGFDSSGDCGASCDASIDDTYPGVFLKLQTSVSFTLRRYKLTGRGDTASSTFTDRFPKQYRIYGSNDGSTWSMLVDNSAGITSLRTELDPTGYAWDTFDEILENSTPYSYHALVVKKLNGASSSMRITKFELFSCLTCPAGQTTDAGLVHWLRFENGGVLNYDSVTGAAFGSLVFDNSDAAYADGMTLKANAGLLGSSLEFKTGKGARSFDIEHATHFDFDTDWTVCFFINFRDVTKSYDSTDGSAAGGNNYMVDFLEYSTSGQQSTIRTGDSSKIEIEFTANGLNTQFGDDNTWTPMCVVHAKSDRAGEIYGDGVSVGSFTWPFSTADLPNKKLTFGRFLAFDSRIGTGEIDDLRIYNRVLTPAQIWDLAQQNDAAASPTPELLPCTCEAGAPDLGHGTCGTCDASAGQMTDAGLVHWLRFENGGVLNYDSVTGAALGTFFGAAAVVTAAEVTQTPGRLGQAVDFPSATEGEFRISNTDATGLDFSTTDWTVCFFFEARDPGATYQRIFDIEIDSAMRQSLNLLFDNGSPAKLKIWKNDQTPSPFAGTYGSGTQLSTGFDTIAHMTVTFTCNLNAAIPPICGAESTITFWENGQSVNAGNVDATGFSTEFLLGFAHEYGVASPGSHGKVWIDDLRIYNRVLTPAEISALSLQTSVDSSSDTEILPCQPVCDADAPGSVPDLDADPNLKIWLKFDDETTMNKNAVDDAVTLTGGAAIPIGTYLAQGTYPDLGNIAVFTPTGSGVGTHISIKQDDFHSHSYAASTTCFYFRPGTIVNVMRLFGFWEDPLLSVRAYSTDSNWKLADSGVSDENGAVFKFSENQWYHFCMKLECDQSANDGNCVEASSYISLFIDGVRLKFRAGGTAVGESHYRIPVVDWMNSPDYNSEIHTDGTGNFLTLGTRHNTDTVRHGTGDIADVRLYGRGLSDAEIGYLARHTKAADTGCPGAGIPQDSTVCPGDLPVITHNGQSIPVQDFEAGDAKYVVFDDTSSEYTVSFPDPVRVDFFLLGGGGGGGSSRAGGGGSGAAVFFIGYEVPAGAEYTIQVGARQAGSRTVGTGIAPALGTGGGNTTITKTSDGTILFRALGGGIGGSIYNTGGHGGSTGGDGTHVESKDATLVPPEPSNQNVVPDGQESTNTIFTGPTTDTSTFFRVQGHKGGDADHLHLTPISARNSNEWDGGGGGGLGGDGGDAPHDSTMPGAGGNGVYNVDIDNTNLNINQHFQGSSICYGVSESDTYCYFGAGGSGGNSDGNSECPSQPLGGGGVCGDGAVNGGDALGKGSGGGGGAGGASNTDGGNGSPGIVMMRITSTTSVSACGGGGGLVCAAGQYLSGTTCAACPAYKTSLAGSTTSDDCGCPPGFYLAASADTSCTACTGDTYKSGIGDDINLCVACPTNSTIDPDRLPAPTRTSAAECQCAAGTYGVPGDVHEYRIVRTDGGAEPVVFADVRFLDASGGEVQIYAEDPQVKEPGGSAVAGPPPPDPSLIAHYKFENDLTDATGNGYDLTWTSAPTSGTGFSASTTAVGSYAVQLATTTGVLEFPTGVGGINPYAIWNAGTGISFAFWVQIDTTSNSGSQRIFSFCNDNSRTRQLVIYKNGATSHIVLYYLFSTGNVAAWNTVDPTGIFVDDTWVHLVFSIDKSGSWNFYANNVAFSTGVTQVLTAATHGYSYLGGDCGALASPTDELYFDDFRIYNKVLSAPEVAELYALRV